ncbi:MAG: hypothetical protein ABIG61_00730 [Planctomycetota bacterium]
MNDVIYYGLFFWFIATLYFLWRITGILNNITGILNNIKGSMNSQTCKIEKLLTESNSAKYDIKRHVSRIRDGLDILPP